jgi:hypothetical protein
VIEKYQIATLHVVAHKVARLIIAYAGPRFGFIGTSSKVIDAECVGLGFH